MRPSTLRFSAACTPRAGTSTSSSRQPSPEAYPLPPLREKQFTAGQDRYQTPDSVLEGWPDELQAITEKIYEDFNKEHGTNFEFKLKR